LSSVSETILSRIAITKDGDLDEGEPKEPLGDQGISCSVSAEVAQRLSERRPPLGRVGSILQSGGMAMSDNGKRRRWTAAEKLRIVLAGMQPGVEVSELCRREGINPTQYYGWKKQLLSSAAKVFDAHEGRAGAREERLASENRRMKDVIAEITAENLELKKGLSG
jgi:transposase